VRATPIRVDVQRDAAQPGNVVLTILGSIVSIAIYVFGRAYDLISLEAALEFPRRVRGLVQIATTPRFVTAPDWADGVAVDVFTGFGRGLLEDYRGTIERFLALETLGSPHAQAQLRELKQLVFARGEPSVEALCDGLAALDASDLRDALAGLAMPSLWIGGRRDRLVPPAALQWAAAHAPHARHLEFNSGHAPFLEFAPAIADALVAFAAELPA